MEQNNPIRSPLRISTALAAAQAQSALASPVRFHGEDGGRSLAEMAQRDLDAALQLLADRAQYITGASGAAIALRRDGRNDMQCRASTGTNAPELGALLSTEFGLSGESVRTRRALRCDDAERDARVNREVCRQMGIASVVVMPVVNDDQVLGVFELFSGKANAFGERDLSAIQRLSEMVETAVRLARAAESLPKHLAKQENPAVKAADGAVQEGQFLSDLVVDPAIEPDAAPAQVVAQPAPAKPVPPVMPVVAQSAPAETKTQPVPVSEPAPKKPLFWSAALHAEADTAKAEESDQSHVPPVLRGLRKCEACGFPVSAGRALCVECEEKKWRGQLRPQSRTTGAPAALSPKTGGQLSAAAAPTMAKVVPVVVPAATPSAATTMVAQKAAQESTRARSSTKIASEAAKADVKSTVVRETSSGPVQAPSTDFVLSAGLEPSQSWLSANKYILGVLLVIASAVAAVFFLR